MKMTTPKKVEIVADQVVVITQDDPEESHFLKEYHFIPEGYFLETKDAGTLMLLSGKYDTWTERLAAAEKALEVTHNDYYVFYDPREDHPAAACQRYIRASIKDDEWELGGFLSLVAISDHENGTLIDVSTWRMGENPF